MTIDREGLKRWYRGAMHRRLNELSELRAGLRARDAAACDAARSVGQALRGSGATYGYPELSSIAAMVESSPDAAVHRRVEGLIEHLHRLAAQDDGSGTGVWAEWLALAAGDAEAARATSPFEDLATAWAEIAAGHGLAPEDLAGRVAEMFHLASADPTPPSKAALRLVPEALMRGEGVLPLRENSETIEVATADPTSLALEDRLQRLTGRTPVFSVAAPSLLHRAIASVLDPGEVGSVPAERRTASVADAPDPTVEDDADRTERVLVVDDDPGQLLLARSLLVKGGYEVEEATDGLAALERLDADRRIALVVADLNMPRLDGLELIWEIRARRERSRIPVIVVTGETDEVLETKLIEEGADDYICKPLDPRLFLARVAATIRRAEH